jgi:predicted O-linked N-acetylglucosamine transferase (SPINDLY family)
VTKQNVLTRSKKQKALALLRAQQFGTAQTLLAELCRIDRRDAQCWHALGLAHEGLGELAASEQAFRQAIMLQGRDATHYYALGVVLQRTGRAAEAESSLREAARLQPDFFQAMAAVGTVCRAQGKNDQAVAWYERALALRPNLAALHFELGNTLLLLGRPDEAERRLRKAVEIDGTHAQALNNLGVLLNRSRRAAEAIPIFRRLIALRPGDSDTATNLGAALEGSGQLSEALDWYRRALALNAGNAVAHFGIANTKLGMGDAVGALSAFREAVYYAPNDPWALGNVPLTLNYTDLSPAEIFSEHRAAVATLYGAINAFPIAISRPEVERRLRVGYVSADFREHSVAHFMEPILRQHDAGEFEVFCYADLRKSDSVTERLRELVPQWRDVTLLDDQQLAERVRADAIDLLVDLAGHTHGNRLGAFARKPAPVQVTYLGYPNTTALPTIDYRLTDALAEPEGAQALHTERLVRLPGCFCCYAPPRVTPPVSALPRLHADHVTFASLNNLAKIGPRMVALWSRIMHALPGSRLLLQSAGLADAGTREHVQRQFHAQGIDPSRIELLALSDLSSHLSLYHRVDIALDTLPWNGHTTTCHALWMGVPVIAQLGERHAGRMAASVLHAIGLDELIAPNADDYQRTAIELASDPARLAELRRTLRERMAASALCDAKTFASNLEAAYRDMWRQCCAAQAAARV